MSAPTRGTRLLIALGGVLAFGGLPMGLYLSVVGAGRIAAAEGRAAAWTTPAGAADSALAWFVAGSVVSGVGGVLACVGLYRMWRSGRLIRPNQHR
jgi:hypothetical protein